MELDEAIAHAKRGEAILFTGAGFSWGAKNAMPAPNDHVPDARTFAQNLAKQLGSQSEYPLPIVSQAYVKKHGESGLVRELLNTFTITEHRDYHEILGALPWRRVYTTNYDSCFEQAALASGRSWTPILTDSNPISTQNICVHINGHISNLSITTLASQVKLTHTSYSADQFEKSSWAHQLRSDISIARAVLFIGYSMSDLDISRILHGSPEAKAKTVFIVGPADDDITIAPLEYYGDVYRIGVEAFAKQTAAVDVADLPKGDYSFTWLIEYDRSLEPVRPEDADTFSLITSGEVKSDRIRWDLSQRESHYCVRRDALDTVIEMISKGRRSFVIHSDLGNGKTIFKEQLSHYLSQQQWRVFWDSDFDHHKKSDIRALGSEVTNEVALFFDQSPDRIDIIDDIMQLNRPNFLVFIFVRSTLYELAEARFDEKLPEGYASIDLNRLSASEATDLTHLLNRGFWGDRGRDIDREKENFINVTCSGSIAKVILSIFEDSDIGRRLKKSAEQLLHRRDTLASTLVASFLLNRLERIPEPNILGELVGVDVWGLMRSDQFKSAAEFIRFDTGRVRIRSSIISEYLLRKGISGEELIWHIEKFVRNLANKKRNAALQHVFTELQRFPMLERLIEGGRKSELIIGYYQSIKELKFCERNAQFWLHYAMARLAFGQFEISAAYFEQAKTFAKGNAKDTRDVNNHYARLLLDSRIDSDDFDDYYQAFEKAHTILIDQMNRNDNRHYPYRQAQKYAKFISYRHGKLSPDELKRFATSCRQVKGAIKNLTGGLERYSIIKECNEAMDSAILLAEETSAQN
jgi:hypothetical protein